MRHLRSILYALVLAPAVWILCGVGFTQDLTGRARDAGSVETASAILLLVLAGAAYAILILSPISPLGPALFGLLFLGVSLWAVVAPGSYAGVWPAAVTEEGFDLSRPGYALAAMLAIPMLCTALSVRRWRGYEPPQLPLIGTLGPARGAAVAPGTAVAAERAAITTADATEVMDLPSSTPPPPGQLAPSPMAGAPWPPAAEPPTEAVPTQAVPAVDADEPTALVVPASCDERTTTTMNDERADDERADDEPTAPVTPAYAAPADETATDETAIEGSGDEPTASVASAPPSPADEATAGQSDDEPTVMVVAEPDDEPAAPSPGADEPTVVPAEEPAEQTPVAEIDEPDEDAPAVEEPAGVDPDEIKDAVAAAPGTEETAGPLPEETVAEVADAEPVISTDDEATADAEPTVGTDDEATADAEPVISTDDEATADAEPVIGTDEEATADAEPTEAQTISAGDDEPTEAHTREAETITADVGADADDGEERTQVLRLPVARTDPDPDELTRPLERGDRTQTAGPGETTQVIFWREPVNQTTPEEAARALAAADQAARDRAAQEQARQAFRDRAAQERAKKAFAERAAQDAREHGDQTQVIDPSGRRAQPIPGDLTQVLPGAGRTEPSGDRAQTVPDRRTAELAGDQTQVIRGAGEPADDHTQLLPRGGTVEPPGDRTQVLSFLAPGPAVPRQNPGERTTDKQEPATRGNSIAGEEQPDPGADPTTRLSSLRPVVKDTGEDTTADVGDQRTKGVLDLERPADETADDTRRLVVPPPRRSPDDEPTTRL